MRIISWNVNGIRAVERKKMIVPFLEKYQPDMFLIQETKAEPSQLSKFLTDNTQYDQYYNAAEKKGYAGTGVWISKALDSSFQYIDSHEGIEDTEGRIVQIEKEDILILGIYFPNGGKSPEAWKGKLRFYDQFLSYIQKKRKEGKKIIFGGDINCAHEEIDLARPETNRNSIGFLPEERAWVSRVIADGFIDIFRERYPEKVMYSWWHLLTKARERNVGWRIDSFFVDRLLLSQVKDIQYLNEVMGSDHCPLLLDIDL